METPRKVGCNREDARSTEAWQLLFIMCGAVGRDVAASCCNSYYLTGGEGSPWRQPNERGIPHSEDSVRNDGVELYRQAVKPKTPFGRMAIPGGNRGFRSGHEQGFGVLLGDHQEFERGLARAAGALLPTAYGVGAHVQGRGEQRLLVCPGS